ncbi:MAG: glycosyltransferase [Phototrophicales bacterium]
MKILFVAMAESVHTARWISQINTEGWDLHLFPSHNQHEISAHLKNITVHHAVYTTTRHADSSLKHRGIRLWFPFKNEMLGQSIRVALEKFFVDYRTKRLVRLIKRLKPDIIHTLEFQHAGYLTLQAREYFGDDFPTWIASSWGNDLYLFGRLQAHESRIRKMLSYVDYYIADCERDIPLAQKYGFEGTILGAFPGGGGYHLQTLPTLETLEKPSQRKTILIKGRHSFAGRALNALTAIRQCQDVLRDYDIVIYFATEDVLIETELLQQETGLNIRVFRNSDHEKWLELLSQARVNIGVSISDGAPLSMLESLLVGTFPIQTHTACADEWLIDGETGIIIKDERNVDEIAQAIRRAVTDDDLVDRAAERNQQIARKRLDFNKIREQVVAMYQKVYHEQRTNRHR